MDDFSLNLLLLYCTFIVIKTRDLTEKLNCECETCKFKLNLHM